MYQHQEILNEEIEESADLRVSRWPGRLLVAAFGLSFLVSLVALWLSGTLLDTPASMVPYMWLQFLAEHRLLALLVPTGCLLVCYGALRSLTGEIMAVPERYMDERQHMLRDQAHRSAFKIIKLACVLVPACLLLFHLLWFNSTSGASSNGAITYSPIYTVYDAQGIQIGSWHAQSSYVAYLLSVQNSGSSQFDTVYTPHVFSMINAFVPPASSTEIALAAGLLVLGLLLVVSALPMCVLAWKGRR